MEATEHYRIGLCKEKVTSTDLANERQRLLGALCGDDLNKALPEVRAMLERQLRAVEAEQAARRAADQ